MLDDFSVVAPYLNDSVMHVKSNSTMRLFSPAKVNLLLAVTGKRADGFHDLISLVTPVSFGDHLEVIRLDETGPVELTCDDPNVPMGDGNLIVRAATAFMKAVESDRGFKIHLKKRIPMEAGLGGGSSNAATTLLALNEHCGNPLDFDGLSQLAADLGSDCPLFLHRAPVIMRGQGEQIETLSNELVAELEGKILTLFKPGIGISTAWAYKALASDGRCYSDSERVEALLSSWKTGELPLDSLRFNTLESPVFDKYVAFPTLFEQIRSELGLRPLMSGSGSSCFVLVSDLSAVDRLQTIVKEAFGDSAFFEIEICKIGTIL